MPFLTVDCGRGLRHRVEVGANTTLGEVVAAACSKKGLDPQAYSLRHGRTRRTLDLSTTFRLSGLDNNATVELVEDGARAMRVTPGSSRGKSSAAPPAGAPCRVALQLESGERRTGSLAPSTTLLDSLQSLCPELLASGALPEGLAPGVVYGRPVTGWSELRSTTLSDLGIKPGSAALLRFRTVTHGDPIDEKVSETSDVAVESSVTNETLSAVTSAPLPSSALIAAEVQPDDELEVPAVTPAPPTALPTASAPTLISESMSSSSSRALCVSGADASLLAEGTDPTTLKVMLHESLLALGQAAEVLRQQAVEDVAVETHVAATTAAVDVNDRAAAPAPPPVVLTSSAASGDGVRSLLILRKYASNILNAPSEPKFRNIKQRNPAFSQRVGRHAAARTLLKLVGFVNIEGDGDSRVWYLPPTAELARLQALVQEIDDILAPTNATRASHSQNTLSGEPALASTARQARLGTAKALPAVHEDALMVQSQPAPSRVPTGGSSRERIHTTLTEAQVDLLKRRKLAVREDITPPPRGLRIIDPSEDGCTSAALGSSALPSADDEVPEEFYDVHPCAAQISIWRGAIQLEVTADDLRSLVLGSSDKRTDAPILKTRAMRELEALQSMREYDRTLIRVRLPGGLIFEAAFHPQEAVSTVLSQVLACLRPELQGIPSHLFFTPPRTTLDQTMSLAAANLTPAATLILGWDVPLPPDVSAAEPRALLAPHARSLLVPQDNSGHGNMQDNALSFPATRSVSAAPPINGAATLGAISSGIGPSTSTGLSSNASSSRVGAEAERKVPKWLKR